MSGRLDGRAGCPVISSSSAASGASDAGPTSAILGSIAVPAGGATASFVEAASKVRLTARWADVAGRIVNINAKKL